MDVTLSICIATFKRGAFIAETLDSVLAQVTDRVEVVVVDGASPDQTPEVVGEYVRQWPQLRYFRESENSGVDADYDKSVQYARGAHVWLMTDDDLLVPGAVQKVLHVLDTEDPDLVVVDAQIRDAEMKRTLQERRFRFSGLRTYRPVGGNALLEDAGDALSFIGGTIMRRSLWMARDRASYYGSLFVHVGVIFQKPIENAVLIGEPLVQIRFGNAMWSARGFEIWMFMWPRLIWSFAGFADQSKNVVTAAEPWKSPRKMLGYRANGSFSIEEYRKFFRGKAIGPWRFGLLAFALLPGKIANLVALSALLLMRGRFRAACYVLAFNSRFATGLGRRMARLSTWRHPA